MIEIIRRYPWSTAFIIGLSFYGLLSYWHTNLEDRRELAREEIRLITSKAPQPHTPPLKSTLPAVYLASLLYLDEDHWTVWVNGEPCRPENSSLLEAYAPYEVNEDGITLSHGTEVITLHPDQTYDPLKKQILSGDRRPSEKLSG